MSLQKTVFMEVFVALQMDDLNGAKLFQLILQC